MVPACSPESQTLKKPPKSTNFMKATLNSVKIHISSHPRFWLFVAFLWVQALIISIARNPPPCFPDRSAAVPSPISVRYVPIHDDAVSNATTTPEAPPAQYTDECPSGRVFAYDLPSAFNRDLIVPNCTDLDPWNWECGIISNHGYGRAATELRRILPEDLHKSWYHTNQFTLEVLFHHRVLKHKCRTLDPELATAFYIPFYAGLAVGKQLWGNDTSARDRHCKLMLRWVKNQSYWKKFNGSDHFMTIGRITWDFRRLTDPGKSWGSSFLNMPSMQKVTRFIVEKYPGDEMDVSVPYPTGFHPKTRDSLIEWQSFVRDYKRSALFSFIGTDRNWGSNDLRRFLMDYCRRESGSCRAVDCAVSDCPTNSSVSLKPLLESEFCLQPKGDSFTSKAVFECMVAGAVPVFFLKTAFEQYEWFLPGEPESYSVYIDQEEVRNGTKSVKEVLMRYSKDEIQKKREKVIETIPRIIYSKPNGGIKSFKDAFDIALDGALERIKEEKEWADFL
ncbi:glycosyltransferase 18 [Perilla frutescens var. hirtella]|uniref:Glycosyltransferase 18 n=1 Tax=Perilla frutescens var. hirtella TaxID=608512 RepID=A0AAD4P1B0_PERFH|nr:glycosyltransferase 18 [Perilla frutescens var. hirtella]KAH6823253.1 glycosyltransferase 18 [Perilla frutescens var. hirtella]